MKIEVTEEMREAIRAYREACGLIHGEFDRRGIQRARRRADALARLVSAAVEGAGKEGKE